MGLIKRKKCKHCSQLFIPDYRNHGRQQYCSIPQCRKASKADSQKKWLSKPGNKNYFKGPLNADRVRQWRRQNPGYWKRKCPEKSHTLQDPLSAQPSENTVNNPLIAANPLQDLLSQQHPVIIGLISNFIGSALQDDIAKTLFRMQQSGQDILYENPQEKGGIHDCQISNPATADAKNPPKFQLDRPPPDP